MEHRDPCMPRQWRQTRENIRACTSMKWLGIQHWGHAGTAPPRQRTICCPSRISYYSDGSATLNVFGLGGAIYITPQNSVLTSLLSGVKGILCDLGQEGSAAGGGCCSSPSLCLSGRVIHQTDSANCIHRWSVQKVSLRVSAGTRRVLDETCFLR